MRYDAIYEWGFLKDISRAWGSCSQVFSSFLKRYFYMAYEQGHFSILREVSRLNSARDGN